MGRTRRGRMWGEYATRLSPQAYPGHTYYSDDCMVRVVWGGAEEGCDVSAQKELWAAHEQAPRVEYYIEVSSPF